MSKGLDAWTVEKVIEQPREIYDALTDLEKSLESYESWFSRKYATLHSFFGVNRGSYIDAATVTTKLSDDLIKTLLKVTLK